MRTRSVCSALLTFLVLATLMVASVPVFSQAQGTVVKVGAGSYVVNNDNPPATPNLSANLKGAVPTNDWCSSIFWKTVSDNMFPHPLGVKVTTGGLLMGYPGAAIGAGKDAVMGGSINDLTLGMAGATFTGGKVDSFSDWFITTAFVDGEKSMKVSFGHGSPFVYGILTGGDATVTFARAPQVWSGTAQSAVLGVTLGRSNYALFGPTGCTWDGVGGATLTCKSNGKNYFSLALLPDNKPETLALFAKYAYSHVTDTKITWSYDEKTAIVSSVYTYTTKQYEGTQTGTVMALYPHQWKRSDAKLLTGTYNSVRGLMKITSGDSFTTRVPFPGVLPVLPNTLGAAEKTALAGYLRADAGKLPTNGGIADTYWEGKAFGRTALLGSIADVTQDPASSKACISNVKSRMEQYFTATDAAGVVKKSVLFKYNDLWGTLIGYPASYMSDTALNDHHFHYGYFIRAAAEVARQDPAWAKDEQWGGMVNMLIRDCANGDRTDTQFPFLRNFDIYEGHSWADGKAFFADGNDNESSSEAMNAWTGIFLWGQMTGNKKMRDLGIYLYTTEMEGINQYWFDIDGTNLPQGYGHAMASMIWGQKTVWGTWFSGEPVWMHVINYMPIQPGSLYLGIKPDYVKKNYDTLVAENAAGNKTNGGIQDIVSMYQALYDAPTVVKDTNFDTCPLEGGNSRTNLYYWCQNLNNLGQVDASVTADTPCYAVFKKDTTRNYVAYNNTDKALTVTFSDGKTLTIEKKGLGTTSGPVK
jgi:endoglucanase Acf2